jgi:hypothetical protein
MRPLPAAGATAQIDDDQSIPEDLVGRLYRASESSISDLLPELSAEERAYLAMFCYRKVHLHRIGLAIAATCEQEALVQTWGTALGGALYAQSREAPPVPHRAPGPHRPKVTLATLNAMPFGAFDQEVEDEVDDEDASAKEPSEITISLS